MSLSPLQLHRYFIEEFFCKANPDFKKGSKIGMDAFQVFFETGDEEDPRMRRIRLTVSLDITKGGNEPFAFKVVLVGFFEVVKEFFEGQGPEAANKLVNVNGPALLYSAARELLALVSGRGPYPDKSVDVLLPSITFLDFQPMQRVTAGHEAVGPKKLPRKTKK